MMSTYSDLILLALTVGGVAWGKIEGTWDYFERKAQLAKEEIRESIIEQGERRLNRIHKEDADNNDKSSVVGGKE